VARWLRVDVAAPALPSTPIQEEFVDRCGGELGEIIVPHDSPAKGRRIVDLNLPEEALVVLIKRDGQFLIPRGGVTLQGGDQVLIAADTDAMARTRELLEGTVIPAG